MPQAFDNILDGIKKSNKGKTNPRTGKPYSEDEMYAMATSVYKKKFGHAPKMESINGIIAENIIFEYISPITFISEKATEKSESKYSPLKISGVAVDESVSFNNIKYTKEELKKSASSLSDKPILKDHKNEIDSLVGRTSVSSFNETLNQVLYDGHIMDKKIIEMIEDGRIKNVSIGAKVEKLRKENPKEANSPLIAEGITFLELSVTPVQGVTNATISQAISEKINLGDIMTEEIKEETVLEENKTEKIEAKEPLKPVETVSLQAMKEEMKSMLKEIVKEELKVLKEKPQGKGVVSSTINQEKVVDDLIREKTREGLSIYSLNEELVYGKSTNQLPIGVKLNG